MLKRLRERDADTSCGPSRSSSTKCSLIAAYDLRASIVGFNLPFDISRLAIKHGSARGKAMRGGFTFKLSRYLVAAGNSGPPSQCPRLADPIHPSAEAARPSWTAQAEDRAPQPARIVHRFEDDCRGAAQPIILARVARRLPQDANAQSRKRRTWEAVDGEICRLPASGRPSHLGMLPGACGIDTRCMRLMIRRSARFSAKRALAKPISNKWACGHSAKVQPDFPPHLTGHILSGYAGGRAEVHLRREVHTGIILSISCL